MDYLDPHKQRQHTIIMLAGYVLIGVGIVVATILLLYQAYGFGVGKNGQIIQSGFVFVSSQPRPAQVSLNGQASKYKTNTRLTLPAGRYTLLLQRSGYRDWQRSVAVEGGDVQHFDYPLLIPKTLSATTLQTYSGALGLATQSPDRRWLVVQHPATASDFDLYDLKDPTKAPVLLTLPTAILNRLPVTTSWQLVEWSNDNTHLLVSSGGAKPQFVVLDRQNPAQSVNLNVTFTASPTAVSLNNKKYDQYYFYDAPQHALQTASLKTPTVAPFLTHVLAYKSYSDDTVLYASDNAATPGKVAIILQVGNRSFAIRMATASPTYALDLTQYSGSLYAVTAASTETKAYVYKDPAGQLAANPKHTAVPQRVLRVNQPNYVAFSANTQFIMAENGPSVAVYDIENNKSYTYTLPTAIDAPQGHLNWMDGDRLVYVSGGKLTMLDYDSTNRQELVAALPAYLPFFAPDTKHLFTFVANGAAANVLTTTSLLAPPDK